MKIPRQLRKIERVWRDPVKWDFLIAICAAIGATYSAAVDKKWIMAGAVAALAIFSICKAIEILRRNAEKESIHELKGCLETLDAIIRKENSRLWLTLHVPIDGGQRLEQILDYVGDSDGSRKAGRRFVAQSGIVGKALREKEPARFSRNSDDYEQYILELVRDHSYTETDARRTNPSTKSGYAAPLLEEDDVKCVLFLASDDANMFDDSTALQINRACVGIARFIKDRYSS